MLKEIINVFSMSSCISMSVAKWAVGGQGYRLEDECAWKPVVSMGLIGVIGSFCHCHAFWQGKKDASKRICSRMPAYSNCFLQST